MKFYKRDPNAALAGMAELTLKQRGAYNSLLDALYAADGDLPDDDRRIARMISCHWREWATVKRELIDLGKVWIEEGYLRAKRVQETVKEASRFSQEQSKRASDGWQKRKKANKNNDAPMPPGNASTPTPIDREVRGTPNGVPEAVELYNAIAREVGWPLCQNLTDRRRSALNARLRECDGLDGWRVALEKARASPLLTGDNDRGWKADFDFLVQAKSFTRLMEGSYDRRQAQNGNGKHTIRDSIAEAERRRDERGHSEESSEADTILLSRL
jgi:uncharacterized protein YdaU (DUF1376 family)